MYNQAIVSSIQRGNSLKTYELIGNHTDSVEQSSIGKNEYLWHKVHNELVQS